VTGTIVALAVRTRTGTIRTEDGSRHAFSDDAVVGDFDTLVVGNRVSFDVDRARPRDGAVTVFREPVRSDETAGGKPGVRPDLRYVGFSQESNVRFYRFDAAAVSPLTRQYVVTVDLALLTKHHICVQEAPALCLRKLASDLKDSRNSQRHELGNADLLAFASTRAAALARRRPRHSFRPRRGSPPPALPRDRHAPGR